MAGCCDSPTPVDLDCLRTSIDQGVRSLRLQLKGNAKKMLKLLFKQYKIESMNFKHPDYIRNELVPEGYPMVIKYYDPYNPETIFEWKIEPDEFKIY